MLSPEKNDIDISTLFNWKKEFKLVLGSQQLTFFMRLCGDAEINRARVFALRKSAELRKALKIMDSDERLAYIAESEDLEKNKIIAFLVYSKRRELVNSLYSSLDVTRPKELKSGSTLEEQEKYQLEVDAYEDKFKEEVSKRTDDIVKKETELLEAVSKDELYTKYVNIMINQLCEQEMSTRFREMCVYFGTFKDSECKVPLFTSYADLDNLQTSYKTELIDLYTELEMSMDELKKLPVATL